jgi:hypothetical protein
MSCCLGWYQPSIKQFNEQYFLACKKKTKKNKKKTKKKQKKNKRKRKKTKKNNIFYRVSENELHDIFDKQP